MRRSHLGEDFIQPLQGPIEMNFNPARCRRHVLAMVFRTPAFHKAHADRTHLGELVHRLEAVIDRLTEELGKLAVVEDLEGTARRDFAHGSWVEIVVVVALTGLDKNAAVR